MSQSTQSQRLLNAIHDDDAAAVKKLIRAGVNVNSFYGFDNRDSPLFLATRLESIGSLGALLKHGHPVLDLELGSSRVPSALWLAAELGLAQEGQMLIDAGADVNRQNAKGRSILHECLMKISPDSATGYFPLLRALIIAGADTQMPGEKGQTVPMLAAEFSASLQPHWIEMEKVIIAAMAERQGIDIDVSTPCARGAPVRRAL